MNARILIIFITLILIVSSCTKMKVQGQEDVDGNTYERVDVYSDIKPKEGVRPLAMGFEANDCEFDMVYVSGGYLHPKDEDQREEYINHFYIGKTEVTQKLWTAVMGYNHSFFVDEENPVETITYDEAVEFTHRISSIIGRNFRLPTEMEWRFAAYGGNASRRTTYSGSEKFWEVAWLFENSGDHTHHVGTKLPNELGIYDMTGNVSEWCSDLYYGNYGDNSNNGCSYFHIHRGATWSSIAADATIMSVSRKYLYTSNSQVGFRLVMDCD